MKLKTYLILLITSLVLQACSSTSQGGKLVRISIVERSGITETISQPERLKRMEQRDYLGPQPYEQVTRSYEKGKDGQTRMIVTSYHPNGQPWRYLEVVDKRANGTYREWYENGALHVEAVLIGGTPDFSPGAQATWLFDGISRAYNEAGFLAAEIPYTKGVISGTARHFHDNGGVWKILNYEAGKLQGEARVLRSDGSLLEHREYQDDLAHGQWERYWDQQSLAARETFESGRLLEASYSDPSGAPVATIRNGHGFRPRFGRDAVVALEEYQSGLPEGLVKEFQAPGVLARSYHQKDGVLHGEEVQYYPLETASSHEAVPKVAVNWDRGAIQGEVKTWYKSGAPESSREFHRNKRHGLSTAWYESGNLMLIEEYDDNKLVMGRYMPPDGSSPASTIEGGSGIATLYDSKGAFLHRVRYDRGEPVLE